MKKVVVMMVAALLAAAPAMATIVNSAHDLSNSSTYTSPVGGVQYGAAENTGDRLCVFCHTPHGATTEAPLWNRGAVDLSTATPYGNPGGTFDFTMDLTMGDAKLCMTCHDGDLTDSLTNLNGAASGTLTPTAGRSLTIPAGATALLGTDFSNDHPVGFVYDATVDAENGLRDIATQYAANGLAPNDLLRGTGSNELWCSSCHNVHEPGTGPTAPFLRTSNSQSALCMTCHVK